MPKTVSHTEPNGNAKVPWAGKGEHPTCSDTPCGCQGAWAARCAIHTTYQAQERFDEMERDIMWTPWNGPGLEHLHLVQDNEEIVADGGIIGMKEGKPFRIWYEIHCDAQWKVRKLSLDLLGRDAQWIRLQADGKGHWSTIHGEPLTSLNGCIDIDISATPFTNTLPIRRLQLTRSQSSEIRVVYIAVPEMELKPAMQRYTCLEIKPYGRLYRYESLPSGYTNEFWVDTDGLIIDYPGLFRRVQSHD